MTAIQHHYLNVLKSYRMYVEKSVIYLILRKYFYTIFLFNQVMAKTKDSNLVVSKPWKVIPVLRGALVMSVQHQKPRKIIGIDENKPKNLLWQILSDIKCVRSLYQLQSILEHILWIFLDFNKIYLCTCTSFIFSTDL